MKPDLRRPEHRIDVLAEVAVDDHSVHLIPDLDMRRLTDETHDMHETAAFADVSIVAAPADGNY